MTAPRCLPYHSRALRGNDSVEIVEINESEGRQNDRP